MAINAAAATAAVDFKGTSVDAVYDSVYTTQTYSDDDYSLDFNWGSAELKAGGQSAYILATAFQVGGVNVPDGTQISTTATIESTDAPGTTESWTCTVNWTKPARDTIGSDNAAGGVAKTAKDAAVSFTVTNNPNVAAWFGDDADSGVSYSSWYTYAAEVADAPAAEPAAPAEGDEAPVEGEEAPVEGEGAAEAEPVETTEPAEVEEAEAPAKNSWQLCSAARIVTSDIADLPVVDGSGLEWKLGTEYKVMNEFSIAGSAAIKGTDVMVTVSESGAMSKFAAAATVLIAMYAF